MDISELRKLHEENGDYGDIKVREYISIANISLLSKDIANGCTEVTPDGMLEVNFINKKLNTDIAIMFYYADIEFPDGENVVANYDWAIESGLYDTVISNVNDKQLFFIYRLIEDEIEQLKVMANSVEASVAKAVIAVEKGINAIIEKLPSSEEMKELAGDVSDKVNNFDPNKLEVIGGLLKKLK